MPSSRKAYSMMVKRGMNERRAGEPIVCFDLADLAIDAVGGRYYCSFVRDVIDAGYFPVFVAWRGTLTTFKTSRFKSRVVNERLGVARSPDEIKEPFILITDRDRKPPANATRVVRMCYERRLCRSPEEIAFPVFVHPRLADKLTNASPADLDAKRKVRMFFGGRTSEGAYDKGVMHTVYHVLSRRKMLDVACSRLPDADILKPLNAVAWLDSNDSYRLVIFETQFQTIPHDRWLEALAKTDFFLACPGVDMPACHNLIESMATSAIPILQYAEYLTPPLQDGVNCLTFHDEESLLQVVDRALNMGDDEICMLRRNVKQHYDEYMANGKFAKRLFSGPHTRRTLLLNEYRVPRT
ncbi:MAG: hypothetical protein H8M99_03355 [Gloeobacteraceae cyanobacterium ES-bin-144]|nr:hypothetical protein [Verrucomicrobiales bacterium]